jgi:hypothetical protein
MDISKAMLDIAKKKYNKYNNAVNFEIQDFEIPFSNKNIIPNETTIACLRLMHRVPLANRKIILRNFLKYSKYLIVSYAINSKYHIIRRWLRNMLFSTTPVPLSLSKHKEINKELTNSGYKVLCEISVNKLLSEQVVFICKANKI